MEERSGVWTLVKTVTVFFLVKCGLELVLDRVGRKRPEEEKKEEEGPWPRAVDE